MDVYGADSKPTTRCHGPRESAEIDVRPLNTRPTGLKVAVPHASWGGMSEWTNLEFDMRRGGTRLPARPCRENIREGTELYREVRGSGPSLLWISGALGDGGEWEKAADLLAEDFTVVSFDRRGNSRSSAPPGWKTTSLDEQADDAAALLKGLGLLVLASCPSFSKRFDLRRRVVKVGRARRRN